MPEFDVGLRLYLPVKHRDIHMPHKNIEMFGGSEAGKKGGKARADLLSADRRREIARHAAESRWALEGKTPLPRATHGGEKRPLRIGDVHIPCYVLNDGRRVISQRGLKSALDFNSTGGARRLVNFATRIGSNPAQIHDLSTRIQNPIRFITPEGREAHGYEASVLGDFCDAVLEARTRKRLLGQQQHIAVRCELLVRGFAATGLIALIDEATGYQADRARDALAKILEAFIAKELQKWIRTFPSDFYQELFRLWKIPLDASKLSGKRPGFIGTLTDNIVYQRLAPGVRSTLREKNPVISSGRRAHKHHQLLTRNLGHPKLLEHLAAVIALMRACDTKEQFWKALNRSLPKAEDMLLFAALDQRSKMASEAQSEPVPSLPD
jgi:hypothetical protein